MHQISDNTRTTEDLKEVVEGAYENIKKHEDKRTLKETRKFEKEQLRRQKRLIALDGKRNNESKEQIALRVAEENMKSALKLAQQSKAQIVNNLAEFDSTIISAANDLRDILNQIPPESSAKEKVQSELTRFTLLIDNAKKSHDKIKADLTAVNIDDPILGQAALMDLASDLTSAHMDLAVELLPALQDLFSIASEEERKA